MGSRDFSRALAVACVLAGLAACSRGKAPETAATTPQPAPASTPAYSEIEPPAPEQAPAGDSSAVVAPAELAGTSWRLVNIAAMDDKNYVPSDPSLYTLEFDADGAVRIKADCNSGTGAWTSASPGQLEFAPIAATQAECGPDSLHDRYMSQFQWVRSYTVKDGHLFLATMADGSIIEFEPKASTQ